MSQEFRLASNFSGPFNFSVGGNYLHYETEENYYVFINALTLYTTSFGTTGTNGAVQASPRFPAYTDNVGYLMVTATAINRTIPRLQRAGHSTNAVYIDPNPIGSLNNEGHNYFLSQNPYTLNSYAVFGETYYNITNNLKLTAGLRWTDDQKHFIDIPSEVITNGYGYRVDGRGEPEMGPAHRPRRPRLDAQSRLHRSDPGLCLVCARLQGGRRQSARRGAFER